MSWDSQVIFNYHVTVHFKSNVSSNLCLNTKYMFHNVPKILTCTGYGEILSEGVCIITVESEQLEEAPFPEVPGQ